jgi:adenosine kinase
MNLYVHECRDMGIPYIYDPSQQIVRLEANEVRCGIEGAQALFVNDYEFALVQKMTGMTMAEMLANRPDRFIVVTRGAQGATVESMSGMIEVAAVEPERIVDPTGVGDAFRGGFLTGYYRGLSLLTCTRMGSLAAAYCLEQRGPQGHSYTQAEFAARYRCLFDDSDQLDRAFGFNI